ncbi:MAG: 30S ribosome-binding factor RbfA [Deltaproteobacteria bacterium]|nr:30S ribosome-binding factor RbfA [Deltaproteobacteria bacterium]MCL5277114.1 30S ribosome-binding factor RbfA [Deltaproteobacteria bacterium]
MIPNRPQRLGELLKEEIIAILSKRVRDPRIGFITINEVAVSPDLRSAVVYYTIIGSDKQKEQAALALEKTSGFIRRELMLLHLNVKHLPALTFRYDTSIDYGERIDNVLRKLKHL